MSYSIRSRLSFLKQVLARGYGLDLEIERIAILGLGAPKSKWVATAKQKGVQLDLTWGPLHLQAGLPDAALIIRKPELLISEEWSISLKQT